MIGASKIVRDITKQKQSERKLELAHEQALAASRAKDDFLAALSHELRTPLSPVLLLVGGVGLSLVTLGLIVTGAGGDSQFVWVAYGVFSSFGTLAYSQAAAGFPLALSGRANTAFNLMVFIGAFAVQWGLGVLIELLQAAGRSAAAAHRGAFLALLVSQLAAYAWFLLRARTAPASSTITPDAQR
jgi:hypothetical protein